MVLWGLPGLSSRGWGKAHEHHPPVNSRLLQRLPLKAFGLKFSWIGVQTNSGFSYVKNKQDPSNHSSLPGGNFLSLFFFLSSRKMDLYNRKRFETTLTILAVDINFGLGRRWIFIPKIKNGIRKLFNYIGKLFTYTVNERIRCTKLACKVWFQIKNTNLPNIGIEKCLEGTVPRC